MNTNQTTAQFTEEELSLAKEIFLELHKIGRLMHDKNSSGLNPGQRMFLHTLLMLTKNPHQGIKASAISKTLGVAQPTIAPLIRSLEDYGIIQRKLSPEDRRVVLIAITPKGMKQYEESVIEERIRITGLVSHLSISDSKTLVDLLKKSSEYFQKNS